MFKKKEPEIVKKIKEQKKLIKKAKIEIRRDRTNRARSNKHGNNIGRLLDYFWYDRRGQPTEKDYQNKNAVNESIYPKSQSLGKYCKRFNLCICYTRVK